MKNKITRFGLLIGFIVSLFAFSAAAQTVSKFRVNIPFDFTVRDKAFRAGDYSINFGGLTQSRNTVVIRSDDGRDVALLSVMPEDKAESSNASKLVFVLDENGYALTEISARQTSAKIGRSKGRVSYAKNFKLVELAMTR